MANRLSGPAELGWDDWFEQRMTCGSEDGVARVAAVDREQLVLVDSSGAFRARLAGRYLHHHGLADDMPCVGDWVCVERQPEDGFGVVHALLERRTALRRRSAGDAAEQQMIAANVDCVVVVQSCHLDFNVRRLERYLVMVLDGGADPYVLLTKKDLVEPSVLASQLDEARAAGITGPVLALSNVTQDGVDDLRRSLEPGRTYCFVGSSGVGKSTLINHLLGDDVLETRDVGAAGKGRHTTTRRELIRLEGGALVIDNPGMREFGMVDADGGMEIGYSDIGEFASGCRYRDCSHTNEPGCAVLEAVESGALSREHFENYLKLRKESEHYRRSAAERRQKERDFGKHVRQVKRDLKKRGKKGW